MNTTDTDTRKLIEMLGPLVLMVVAYLILARRWFEQARASRQGY